MKLSDEIRDCAEAIKKNWCIVKWPSLTGWADRAHQLEAEVAIHEDALAILANCHIVESYEGRAETEIAKAIKVAREEWEQAREAEAEEESGDD